MLANGSIISGEQAATHPPHISEQFEYAQRLVQLFITQLINGCGNTACPASTCYTHRKATATRPLRRLTTVTARAAALYLASLENAPSRLCPTVAFAIRSPDDGALPDSIPRNERASSAKKDPKSFAQQLFDTAAVKKFADGGSLDVSPRIQTGEDDADQALWRALAWLETALSCGSAEDVVVAWMESAQQLIERVPPWPSDSLDSARVDLDDTNFDLNGWSRCFENEPARRLATRLVEIMAQGHHFRTHLRDSEQADSPMTKRRKRILELIERHLNDNEPLIRTSEANTASRLVELEKERSKGKSKFLDASKWPKPLVCGGFPAAVPSLSPIAILARWFHQVFLDTWDGSIFVKDSSIAGGALIALSLLFELFRPGVAIDPMDLVPFEIPRVSKKLDFHDVANQMLNTSHTDLPLPIFPWLLPDHQKCKIFRALCYLRMTKAVDQVRLYIKTINEGIFWMAPDAPPIEHLTADRLRIAASTFFAVIVNRDKLLEDTFNQVWRREARELERPLRVSIVNEGEEGQDQGGVAQELFSLVFAKVFDPDYAMFIVDERTKMAWFDPKSLEPLYKYEVLGVLMAVAIFNGFTLPVTFPLALYAKLLGRPWDDLKYISDIEDGWPDLANGFRKLLDWDEGDVADVFFRSYAFSFKAYGKVIDVDMTNTSQDDSQWSPIALMANSRIDSDEAPLVSNANRNSFVSDYIYWLTTKSVRAQFDAFAKGFYSLIDTHTLTIFDPRTLQRVVEGQSQINVDELQGVTGYDGYSSSDQVIQDFWDIVGNEFDNDQRKKLLEFVTASDRLPVSGTAGVEFFIQRNGGNSESIPGAMTCFGRLLLPEYATKDKLRSKLNIALDNARGFGVR